MRRRVLVLAFVVTPGCSDDGTDASPTTGGADDGATTMAAGSTAAVDDGGGPTGTSVSGPDGDDADGVDDAPPADDGVDESGGDDGGQLGLPPENGGLDYQLGGAYPPPEGVAIVSRDRQDPPAEGLYNVCYVNGFQIQPDEEDFWMSEHPDLILVDGSGNPVIDPDWDEMLLDTSTPEKREAIAAIVGEWIAGCDTAGYDAIEIDNLDTYTRSQDLLTQDHNVAQMALFSEAAHAGGMAIAQKNSTELVPRRVEMGTDFVVAEECNTYDECGDYIDGYGNAVLMIEYVAADFDAGCAAYPDMSIVLRDLDLVTPSDAGYVYQGC